MVRLYPYQTRAVLDCVGHLRNRKRTLLVAPTGSGKTVIAAEIAQYFTAVRLVAHRIEIVEQARARGIAAVTLAQALKLDADVDLLIIDEAHRAAAQTYRQIIEKYEKAALLGLTATPLRTDGQGLCDAFDEMIVSSSIVDLIADERLVPYRAFVAPAEALQELKDLKHRGGDYATKELADVMDRPRLVGNIVREYQQEPARGRKTICFAVSVEHSLHLTEAFREAGIRAVHLDGHCSAKLRAEGLARLANGEIDVLCNVNLFTEGWDCPSVSCVIMARPTESLTLYLQSVGRGMRPSPGKVDLVILDHAGNIDRHGWPDQSRDWSLESSQQKAKRLADIAELERLHSLGFASLEAELEEKKRFVAATYSTREAAELLGFTESGVRQSGIKAIKHRNALRYAKSDIQSFIENRSRGISISSIAHRFDVSRDRVRTILRRRKVPIVAGGSVPGSHHLYLLSAVEAIEYELRAKGKVH